MDVITSGIGCRLDVVKITRCSVPEAAMADSLSKGHFMRFWGLANLNHLDMPLDMAWVPLSLKTWIMNPQDDPKLGYKILAELANYTNVLSYNC